MIISKDTDCVLLLVVKEVEDQEKVAEERAV